MKFQSQMVRYFLFGSLAYFAVQGCESQRLVIGESSCAIEAWSVDDYFTKDVLPGMESNLRKQRTYFITGKADLYEFNDQNEWLLAVDSVLISLSVSQLRDDLWQWSGSRNFYQSVREGVLSMEEVNPDRSGLDLNEEAFLIRREAGRCRARLLPAVRNLGTIAMP
tara:strand:+ start:1327 stop:1824 length:498 start_codon:yes stop_codon:yes gene_type:complete